MLHVVSFCRRWTAGSQATSDKIYLWFGEVRQNQCEFEKLSTQILGIEMM
jgi:hypothetical protein